MYREDVDIDDLEPYHVFDLFMGIRASSQQWDVSIFARNLFDEDEIIRGSSLGLHRGLPTGYQAVDVVAPRLIGLRASYNF